LEVINTVITSPYLFYFVFVPREASNLSEVRFGDVAVINSFRCCTIKIRENYLYIFWTWDFLCICPRLYPNFH
jgi:hypothetical protein